MKNVLYSFGLLVVFAISGAIFKWSYIKSPSEKSRSIVNSLSLRSDGPQKDSVNSVDDLPMDSLDENIVDPSELPTIAVLKEKYQSLDEAALRSLADKIDRRIKSREFIRRANLGTLNAKDDLQFNYYIRLNAVLRLLLIERELSET